MSQVCTRCDGTGFLNIDQVEDDLEITIKHHTINHDEVLRWIARNADHDVQICDCCGDGERWYGAAGWHYLDDDPPGRDGPYAYNGGLCECN